MENLNLKKIAKDEDLMDKFFITFASELASDEEPSRKKFNRLYQAYLDEPGIVDDIMMTLCGWTMASLAEKTLK